MPSSHDNVYSAPQHLIANSAIFGSHNFEGQEFEQAGSSLCNTNCDHSALVFGGRAGWEGPCSVP